MSSRHVVARTRDLADGEMRGVRAGERPVLLARVDGRWYAIDDACTHLGPPLSDGALDGFTVECRHHGGRFDLRDGRVLRSPPGAGVNSYPVETEGDDVIVVIPDKPWWQVR